MSRELQETIRHYLLLRGISQFGVSFTSAFYVTFLLAKGLNLFEVNLVNFMFYTTLFICEIPTGAFADVFGRKRSYIISCALFSLGTFAYGYANSFWGYVGAEVVVGIGATFASGAFRAWLIDRLRHRGFTGSLSTVFAREQQVHGIVGMVAPIIGVYLASWSLSLPWFAAGTFMAITSILAARYMREEDEFIHQTFSFVSGLRSMRETVYKSVCYSRENGAVRFILGISIVQMIAVQALNMQWQPFFVGFSVQTEHLGYVYAAISIAVMSGAGCAPWVLQRMRNEQLALAATQAVVGICILLAVASGNLSLALLAFLAHEFARGVFNPLKDVYLNDNIPSKERATIISFVSLSYHVGGMGGLLVSGALAEYFSIPTAWTVSGAILTLSALVLHQTTKRTRPA